MNVQHKEHGLVNSHTVRNQIKQQCLCSKRKFQNQLHSELIKGSTKQRHKGTNKKMRRLQTKMAGGLWTILSFLIAYKMFGLRKKKS